MSTAIGSAGNVQERPADQTTSRPDMQHWGRLAALLALALVVGLGAGWLAWGRTPGEGSPEVSFARDMAAHHDQAVEMSVIMRDRTSDPALRQLMIDITLTQQNQIGQMNGWLNLWGRPLVNGAPMQGHGTMMGMATQEQVNALHTLPVAEGEVSFLTLMIAHHHGGVAMAKQALAETSNPQVVRLANSIVVSQQSEISLMEGMLRERGAEVPATPSDQQGHDGMVMP